MSLRGIRIIHGFFLSGPLTLLFIVYVFHKQAVQVEGAQLDQFEQLSFVAALLLFFAELGGARAFRSIRSKKGPFLSYIVRMALLEIPAILAIVSLFLFVTQIGPLEQVKSVRIAFAVLCGYGALWALHFPRIKHFQGGPL